MIYSPVRRVSASIAIMLFVGALTASNWGSITGNTLAGVSRSVDQTTIQDLIAANRILADQGIVDGFGHVSVRHPTNPNRFLLARSIAPALVTAEDILEYDLGGIPIDDRGRSSYLERFIHSEIYKMRADVMSVIHTHSPTVIPFGVTGNPMRAIQHMAGFLAQGVPVFAIRAYAGMSNLLVSNNALGKALAETLNDKSVVLMRWHGDVVV
jgi:ribulose-5-phosphate 4-epimerase/fuculose-1-phosphate aldolase